MSDEVKRYQPKAVGYSLESHPVELVECKNGPAVLYEDHRAAVSAVLESERGKELRLHPVTDEEWQSARTFYDGTDHDYDVTAMERDFVDALLAARREG